MLAEAMETKTVYSGSQFKGTTEWGGPGSRSSKQLVPLLHSPKAMRSDGLFAASFLLFAQSRAPPQGMVPVGRALPPLQTQSLPGKSRGHFHLNNLSRKCLLPRLNIDPVELTMDINHFMT